MPTIVFASPKGGVAKTTSAVLLATELAAHGATVTIIDADPNKPLSGWAKRPGKPETLTVLDDVTEDTIIDAIDAAAADSGFVIVDLPGAASMMIGYAISRADLRHPVHAHQRRDSPALAQEHRRPSRPGSNPDAGRADS
jgi:chromosome partitioning protein